MSVRCVATALVLFWGGVALAGEDKVPKGTADYVRAMGSTLEGKEVKIDVACLEARVTADDDFIPPGVRAMWAVTASTKDFGGKIEVTFPLDQVEKMIKKYGIKDTARDFGANYKIQTKELKGTLRKGTTKWGDPVWYIEVAAPAPKAGMPRK